MLSKYNIVYKTVGGLDLCLDLHLPDNAENVAVVLWLHGPGGAMAGRRDDMPPHVRASVDKYRHALITADYRFAPQVGVPEIFEDVKACIKFIRSPTGLKIAAETEDTSQSAFAFKKGQDALAQAVDGALEELRADGTLAQISEKYFGADVTQ